MVEGSGCSSIRCSQAVGLRSSLCISLIEKVSKNAALHVPAYVGNLGVRGRVRKVSWSFFISDLEKSSIVCETRGFRSPPRGRLGANYAIAKFNVEDHCGGGWGCGLALYIMQLQ
jgi:hypothetical protein